MATATQCWKSLGEALDRLRGEYGPGYLASDPVRYPHRYRDFADREVTALLAAGLAFGRVAAIFKSVEDLLHRLGPEPARRIDALDLASGRRMLAGFRHRWIGEEDMLQVLQAIRSMRQEHGSLVRSFAAGDRGGATLREALGAFTRRARSVPRTPTRGFRYFFSGPGAGSACKRMNLFLRWVVRPADGVDLGLWRDVSTARLIIPLDTHLAFMGRALGLSSRRRADWRMAEEITAGLRRLDARDPVKYDWALSRLGILGDCPERRDPNVCRACPLVARCRL